MCVIENLLRYMCAKNHQNRAYFDKVYASVKHYIFHGSVYRYNMLGIFVTRDVMKIVTHNSILCSMQRFIL